MEGTTSAGASWTGDAARELGRVASGVPGPLLLVVGALHGNEPAGVLALERLFEQLRAPGVLRRGTVLGLVGNAAAFRQNLRYQTHDLNRHFTDDRIRELEAASGQDLEHEDAEALALLRSLDAEIGRTTYDELVFLDIHTTTADGGDFITATHDPESLVLAKALGPPVVLGLTDVLAGTLAAFITPVRTGLPTRAFAYEAGQHTAPASADRSLGLLRRLLELLDMAEEPAGAAAPLPAPSGLDEPADRPALTRICFRLAIPPGSAFVMLPGFRNFDPVQAGQVLAYLDGETVVCDEDGFILMPLYQAQGNDGYFLVKEVAEA